MVQPKFRVGQKVYAQSDWFAGSYIPECYTIRSVHVQPDGSYAYCVKGRKRLIAEDVFSATEEEAQMREVERFKMQTERKVNELREQLINSGIALGNLHLIGEAEPPKSKGFKYNIGDVVYGHMDGAPYEYKPETFIITERHKGWYRKERYNAYHVKRHGTRPAYEEFLYPTYEEALIAELIRYRATFKGEVKSIEARAKTLGIEAHVKAQLSSWSVPLLAQKE
jgi:hypothetical protein